MTWFDLRWSAACLFLCACVGDAAVANPGPDASPDSTSKDAQAETGSDAGPSDGGGDAVAEAQAPCPDGGTLLLNGSSGVQCDGDGGANFCAKNISSCCTGGNPATKCATKGTCGSLTEWSCDQASDCTNGQKCCLNTKGSGNQQCGGSRVTDTTGSHCAATCNADEIVLCGGDQTNCLNSTCKPIQIITAPYRRVSGCL